ncbi:MAG: gliding motility-associated C-terminal domain-containing protein [Bacteroides sp.]|nr:gliding motility-associated C-terminal domain-containing protein [Bacteroides sp.]
MQDYRVVVTYNEGYSAYTKPMTFNVTANGEKGYGEEITATSIKMADICSMVKDVAPDSVCEDETVDLYVYSQNFAYDTLKKIVWNDPAVKAVGSGIEDWNDYQYIDNKGTVKTQKIKRFHYQVVAKGNGVYPYEVHTKIRDSIYVRLDTIRVAVLKTPRIFIQDTIFACDGQPLDLRPYVNASVVDMSSFAVNELTIPGESVATGPCTLTGTLKYKCSRFPNNKKSETVQLLAEYPVYNAWIPDSAYCPGEIIKLQQSGTNGRLTWTRRVQLAGGGFSQPDTLLVNGKSSEVLPDEMSESDHLYTVTAQTACPTVPPISVQFMVISKDVPEVNIIDNSACSPAPLLLETAPWTQGEIREVKWFVNNQEWPSTSVNPTSESVEVRCDVTATNGCFNSNTATLYSYPAPQITITVDNGPITGGIYCAQAGETVLFTGTGAESYEWSRPSETNVKTGSSYSLQINKDDILSVEGTESAHNCSTKVDLPIYLAPAAKIVSEVTECQGASFAVSVESEAFNDVGYLWYDPNGDIVCPCDKLGITDYDEGKVGVYELVVERKGCRVERSVELKMYPVPKFDFADSEFCEGEPLKLSVETGLDASMQSKSQFTWYDKDGNELPDQMGSNSYTGKALSLADGGDYRLHIKVDNQCDYDGTVTVKVDPHSHPNFAVDPFYCEGADFVTKAEDQGDGATYGWYSSNRPFLTTPTPETLLELGGLMMEDSAYLTLTVYRGACVDDTSIFIHVRSMPKPEIELVGALQDEKGAYYCEGSPIRLDVPDARVGDTISWYFNGNLIPGAASGSYGVAAATLEDNGKYGYEVRRNGCNGETSLYVDVRALPVPLVQDTFMCSGKTFVMDAYNAQYPDATFSWSTGSTGRLLEINAGGTYSVVMSYAGCDGNKSFTVEERPSPYIGFPEDTVMCQRDSILLTAPGGMDTYRWQDGSSGQTYLVTSEGAYTLFVELTGCTDYNEIFVHEDFCSNLYFPSAFSPNGDAINDRFGPITTAEDDQVVYSLYIYNRNGEKVFESHSLTESWDGTYKGEKCPGGVYIYRCIAHARQNGRKLSADGTVTLLR